MGLYGWITFVACTGQLTLALLAALLGRRSRLSLVLTLLSLDFFLWNFASLAYELSGKEAWHWLDVASSPLSAPLALNFLLVFLGERQRYGKLLLAAYAYFGVISAAALSAFFFEWARRFSWSLTWSYAHLFGLLPVIAWGTFLLVRHVRHTADRDERSRSLLLLAGFAVLAILGLVELLGGAGARLPPLANVGALVCNIFVVLAALRFQLLDQAFTSASFLRVLAMGTLAFCAFVVVFRSAGTSTAALAVGLAIGTLALTAASLQLGNALAARRERMRELATLGRFSAELAHNLKNPVAALKGSAQLLKEELKQKGSIERQAEFVDLILEQTERVQRSLEQYQQLGKVQPIFKPIQLNEIVRDVMKLSAWRVPGITVRLELEEGLPTIMGDARLVEETIENLVSNALEAMAPGGTLVVRTELHPVDRMIALSVADSGSGMNAATRARAFDDFFTTKSHGMGMGLAFVRRVVDAHGGRVSVSSQQGRGTTVRVQLPSV